MQPNKSNGLFMLEVLFAIVIISGSMIGIFTVLKQSLLLIGKIKKENIYVFLSPLIYSSQSPLINHKTQNKDCSQCFFEIMKVDLVEKANKDSDIKNFNIENVFAGKKNINQYDVSTVYSNVFLMIPESKKGSQIEENNNK